ncbi:hypothetical protein FGO68_gene17297 [Halteria grandinella]|uniref:Uncharacterized protein n=1 Tax=Halteria grandinella TaxID=5974 RepID=A0A8J8T2L2_HALGN|nr:hypothetical protein FGO68_gene17297 [Halteria grandinella]
MSDSIDPITLLRETIISGKLDSVKLIQDKRELLFEKFEGGLKLPLDHPTAWKSSQPNQYLTLGQIWLYMCNLHLSNLDYMKRNREVGTTMVTMNDREPVKLYFSGQAQSADNIDEIARPSTVLKKSYLKSGKQVQSSAQVQEQMLKRREVKQEEKREKRDKKCIDFINECERKLSGKTNCLQAQGKSFLQVLQLGYTLTGRAEKAKEVQERIKQRMEQIASQNARYSSLSGANRALLGVSQIVDVDVGLLHSNKNQKRRSLLEEIQRMPKAQDPRTMEPYQRGPVRPIIIVPASFSPGSISLTYAKSFLQNGEYDLKQAAVSVTAPVIISRKINDETQEFEIHDSVTTFTDTQWKRIVAVFVNGQEWQFKDWADKLGGAKRYVELFLRVRGYFLHFADQAPPEQIGKWNIKLLPLQRNKRHQDVTVYNELWSDLEAFLHREKFKAPDLSF